MSAVILRAVSLTLVILIGIGLRTAKVVDDTAGTHVKTILLNITLPAAIITNFSKIESIGGPMAVIIFLGIAANLVMIGAGAFLSRKKCVAEKAFYMNCLPAYNIGTFCLPFVQSFLLPLERKKEMGLSARRKVEQEFDRMIVINAYMKEIRQIAGRDE